VTAAAERADMFSAPDLIAPDYGGMCIDAVLPAAAGALGVSLGGAGLDAATAQTRLGVPSTQRVCVVLIDGLGHQMLAERAGHASFLRRAGSTSSVLTVGYPSTTAASMGLFGTGRGAGLTGLAGYTVRNPQTGGLANLVSWDGADDPEEWQPEPTLPSLLVAAGVAVTSVGPAKFAGSGLTRAALRGSQYVAAESLTDRVDATLFELSAPGLVYLYWGDVDKTGHQHGWQSNQWAQALTEVDRALDRLARSVPRGTVVLITADHGMVDVDPDQLIDVAATPALARHVELVAGEPRASHVHCAPGTASEVLERWRTVLADRALVVVRDEAIALGWFGPVSDRVRPMIGDLVVAATGRAGVVDSRTQTPHSLTLRGMHGSFTPGEMLVPLVLVA
jgi:hypothetical protein